MKKRTYKVYYAPTNGVPQFIKEIHNVVAVDLSDRGYILEENDAAKERYDPKSKYHYFPISTILIEI